MNNIPSDVGKKVTVLGLGESGYQSALELKKLGFQVFATDKSENQVLRERVKTLIQKGIEAECGAHSLDRVQSSDWILISPGIPPQSEVYQTVLKSKKPVFSEIEAASWFCSSKNIVAVTGSCGKTTTVTLIERILKAAGRDVVLCGNIGNPWIGELNKIKPDTWVVLEVSSFQLKHCRTFAPHIGILLNIHPNHLDWHPTIEDYSASKLKIFEKMQSSDWMLVQKSDEEKYGPFNSAARKLYLKPEGTESLLENAARQTAEILKIHSDVSKQVLQSFEGLEHRLEKFWEQGGIQAVNDSKSTTPASLIWALERYPDKSVVLITGGRVKTPSFKECLPTLRQKEKKIIVIGEARDMMLKEWHELSPQAAESLESACHLARSFAQQGDTLLFSPACSSFDMFKSYIDRGNQFKALIRQTIKE